MTAPGFAAVQHRCAQVCVFQYVVEVLPRCLEQSFR